MSIDLVELKANGYHVADFTSVDIVGLDVYEAVLRRASNSHVAMDQDPTVRIHVNSKVVDDVVVSCVTTFVKPTLIGESAEASGALLLTTPAGVQFTSTDPMMFADGVRQFFDDDSLAVKLAKLVDVVDRRLRTTYFTNAVENGLLTGFDFGLVTRDLPSGGQVSVNCDLSAVISDDRLVQHYVDVSVKPTTDRADLLVILKAISDSRTAFCQDRRPVMFDEFVKVNVNDLTYVDDEFAFDGSLLVMNIGGEAVLVSTNNVQFHGNNGPTSIAFCYFVSDCFRTVTERNYVVRQLGNI